MTWMSHPYIRENHDVTDTLAEMDLPWWTCVLIILIAGPIALVSTTLLWLAAQVRRWR